MDDSETPGSRLRRARRNRDITAADLAITVGLSASAVRNHENGTNGIPSPVVIAYAEALGITPQWLQFGDATSVNPLARPAPVALTQLPDGKARLEMNTVLPFSVALQILALVQGDEK